MFKKKKTTEKQAPVKEVEAHWRPMKPSPSPFSTGLSTTTKKHMKTWHHFAVVPAAIAEDIKWH